MAVINCAICRDLDHLEESSSPRLAAREAAGMGWHLEGIGWVCPTCHKAQDLPDAGEEVRAWVREHSQRHAAERLAFERLPAKGGTFHPHLSS